MQRIYQTMNWRAIIGLRIKIIRMSFWRSNPGYIRRPPLELGNCIIRRRNDFSACGNCSRFFWSELSDEERGVCNALRGLFSCFV
jgi:hypothetical protein